MMNKNYIAPEAEILCFRPVEDLAMEDLLNPPAEKEPGEEAGWISGDVFIQI